MTTHHVARLARENGLWLPARPGRARAVAARRDDREQRGRAALVQVRRDGRLGDRRRGGARARRARALRRPGAQGRRRLRPARAAVRLGGDARDRHGGVAAADPGARGAAAGARDVPDTAAGCAAIERVLGSGIAAAVLEYARRGGAAARSAAGWLGAGLRGARRGRRLGGRGAARARRAASRRCPRARCAVHAPRGRRRDPRSCGAGAAGVSHAVSAARGAKLSEDIAVPLDRARRGDRRDRRDRRAPRPRGVLVGPRGRRQPARDVPADARRRRAARARRRGGAASSSTSRCGCGGTVTGEHGIGVLKRGQLSRQWAPAAVAAHRAIKAALDPKGLFNPGKKEP